MPLRIALTGRLRVEGPDGAFDGSDLPGRQGRLVLAYLALNHHPVPRDELAELVWGDALPRSWERDLSAVVSKLKALFARVGAEAVLTGAFGCYELRLPSDTILDVEAAAVHLEEGEQAWRAGDVPAALGAAASAAILARRPFLPGDEGDWVEGRRQQLGAIALRGLDMMVDGHRRQGNLPEATRQAQAAIEVDPYRETGYAALMRVHLDAGNRAEALRVYERCRALLVEELGVPPGPEVAAVHRAALDLDSTRRPARPLPAAIGVAVDAGRLVGRDEQMDRLRAAWERAGRGEFGLLLICGEPGIGKTRLAGELAKEAHSAGAWVLFGRCDPEPLASYQPFTEALRQWLAAAPGAEVRSAAAGSATDLSGLLPDLATAAGMPGADGARDRMALYDAVGRLLGSIGRAAPVLLVVDDLHAADLPTLALLRRLARAARPQRVLLVGTYRHAEPDGTDFAEFAADLRLDGLAGELALSGLDAQAGAELVTDRFGRRLSDEEAETWHARTGGNPLFLSELARGGGDDAAAPGVRAAIGRHLARLPQTAREPLSAASVLGHTIDLEVLGAVVECSRADVVAALEPAVAAQVLTEDPQGAIAFAHPLLRETLYEGLRGDRRRDLHRRAGLALESLRAGALQPLAHHFTSAGDDVERAVRYSEAAAKEAARLLALEDCLQIIDRVLELVPEGDSETRRRLLSTRARASIVRGHAAAEGRRIRIVE